MHLSLLAVGNRVPKGCRAEASVVGGIIYCLFCEAEKNGCHFIEVRRRGGEGQKSFPRGLVFGGQSIIHVKECLFIFYFFS